MKKLEKIKDLLIIVDMVNGFVKEGALADPYISRLIPLEKKLIEFYKQNPHGEVAFVKEAHHKNSREFNSFPPHCIVGTEEAELVEGLKEYEKGSIVYPKNSTSVIFNPNFIKDLNYMPALERVVFSGCCTDICVMNAAIPLVNYFNQEDKQIDVYAPRELAETYDIPGIHDRKEYNEMAIMLMDQAGVHTETPKDLVHVLTL